MHNRQLPMSTPARHPRRLWTAVGVAALVALQATLAISSLLTRAVTIDESGLLPAGCTYWLKGTFGLYHQSPPLLPLWMAAPALWAGAHVDFSQHWDPPLRRDRWVFAIDFMEANRGQYRAVFAVARMAIVALVLAGGLLVFHWARRLFGTAAGLTALALWSLCPNLLAHGGLATTDAGAAVLIGLAVWALWRYCRRPGWPRALGAGGALGLAVLAKFSSLVLYPLFFLLVVADHLLTRSTGSLGLGRKIGHLAAAYAVSGLMINGTYLGEGTFTRLGDYRFLSKPLARDVPPTLPRTHTRQARSLTPEEWQAVLGRENAFRGTWLEHLPVPLPYHFVAGYDQQKSEAESGYWMFLDGQAAYQGWWYYYLAALTYKMPIGTLALAAIAGVVTALTVRGRWAWADQLFLLGPMVGILAAFSFLTNICIGVRYVLPILPFAFVWVSQAVGTDGPRWRRLILGVATVAALAWNAGETAMIHPHYLAYFNQIAGGPDQGYRRLGDSNIDWGQDLPLVEQYVREHPDEPIGLAYFGAEWPGLAGLRYRVPPFFQPAPGTYAVSVNFLQGRPWTLRDADNHAVEVPADAYRYFQQFEPIAKLGYSIFLYRLTEADLARWQALPAAAVGPR